MFKLSQSFSPNKILLYLSVSTFRYKKRAYSPAILKTYRAENVPDTKKPHYAGLVTLTHDVDLT
jgi:hypothetical protein